MPNTTDSIKKNLAEELHRCIERRYRTTPSNEQLAKDFYFASGYRLKVTRETFRKWLKGEVFPDLERLVHLIDWLEMNMSNVFLGDECVLSGHAGSSSSSNFRFNYLREITPEKIDDLMKILDSIKNSEIFPKRGV